MPELLAAEALQPLVRAAVDCGCCSVDEVALTAVCVWLDKLEYNVEEVDQAVDNGAIAYEFFKSWRATVVVRS